MRGWFNTVSRSDREWRLATGGYLGHMFELYSFWTWIPLVSRGRASIASGRCRAMRRPTSTASLVAFLNNCGLVASDAFGVASSPTGEAGNDW